MKFLTYILIFSYSFLAFGQTQVKQVDASKLQQTKTRYGKTALVDTSKLKSKMKIDYAKIDAYKKIEKPYLHATVMPGEVLLTWSTVKDAKGYNLYFRPKSKGRYERINTDLIADSLSDSDANLLFGSLMPVDPSKDPIEGVNCIYETQHILTVLSQALGYKVRLGNIPFSEESIKPILRYLGPLYFPIALIIGQAYDHKITQLGFFDYKITYVDASDAEHDFANTVTINTEDLTPLPKQPTGLTATAGDTVVLLLWNDPTASEQLYGYSVYQATSSAGAFKRVNLAPVLSTIPVNLKGDSLKPPQYGYIDTALVNKKTYDYYVAARSAVGTLGAKSAIASATPVDMTPPLIPQNINISTSIKSALAITWKVVRYDTLNRKEKVKGYRIFRYPDYATATDIKTKDSQYYLGFVPNPKPPITIKYTQIYPAPLPPTPIIFDKDTSYVDSPPEAEKAYWYRISCEDSSGNIGKKSAAVYCVLPDFTPPDPPVHLDADPDTQCVRLTWQPPDTIKIKKNRDLAGYLIYRGICGKDIYDKRETKKCIVCYSLGLLKDITDKTTLEYKDCSLPKGSPICYRYVMKAYDKSQNLSLLSDSICVRLRDKTPPETPVMTALQARNQAIRIEAVSPPVQDMKGFIVQRREDSETEFQTVYGDSTPEAFGCKDIPVSTDSILAKKVNVLDYLDKKVEPEKIYWYRVKAFDIAGNTSEPSPPISTFTFEINNIAEPTRLQAKQQDCQVILNWLTRSHITTKDLWGYVIYRSLDAKQGYRQISGIVKEEQFKDEMVVKGVTYWYKVQAFDDKGDRSPLSDPISINVK